MNLVPVKIKEHKEAIASMSEAMASHPEQLALAAQAGSLESFEGLVVFYEKRLLHFILKKTGDRDSAEDLLQEVFIKVYQNLEKYDGRRSFTTWIYAIAYNHTMSYFRSKRTTVSIEGDYVDAKHPGGIIEQEDLKEHIWSVARQLPKGQFDVLWFRYAENMSIKDVAKIMNKTQVNIKVILYRARKELLKVYDPQVIQDLQTDQGGCHALSVE